MNLSGLQLAAADFGLSVAVAAVAAQPARSGVERLYIIDCGHSIGPDKSRWTPGIDVGKPVEMVGNCYLIRHAQGWLLWDTGVTDAVATMPGGRPGQKGSPHWFRPKTLAGEIEKLGLKPSDIRYLAISHTHPDHVGNVPLFPQSMLLVQRAEYDWPSPFGPRFDPKHPVTKLDGDHDVFGDGSVMIFATPGHTPGSQVLMVKLQKFGAVMLSGDAVHFRYSLAKRIRPVEQCRPRSDAGVLPAHRELLAQHKAQLWANHDKEQHAGLKKSPEYYE